jgi:CubicO group peptidase (beta-lactamase class C family)
MGLFRQQTGGLALEAELIPGDYAVDLLARARTGGDHWRLRVHVAPAAPYRVVDVGLAPAVPRAGGGLDLAAALPHLDRFLEDLVAAGQFSGVVRVDEAGTPVFVCAAGVADPATGAPNGPDTRFNAGSVAKTFAGALTAQLVGEGVLRYDDPVARHLPELGGAVPAGATVHHLLTHTAGLGDAMLDTFLGTPKHRFRRVADYLALCRGTSPVGAAGERFRYANTGYVLLAAVL